MREGLPSGVTNDGYRPFALVIPGGKTQDRAKCLSSAIVQAELQSYACRAGDAIKTGALATSTGTA